MTLRGFEYLAEKGARQCDHSMPAVIVSHGFMANQKTVKHYAEFLADLGFAAFTFDFAGGCVLGGKSDGKTDEMSVLTEADDLCAVLDHVRQLSYVDRSKVFLMGCSQGGLVSALVAAKRASEVAGLVMFYPALCIPDDARRGKMMFARFDPNNVPVYFWCGPMKLGRCYAKDAMGLDPFKDIESYTGSVLIVHGTKDKIVDARYAEEAYRRYSERCGAANSVELVMIDGGGHGFVGRYDKEALEALKTFMRKNIRD